MFDTHCHLNFSRFKKNYEEVIERALEAGVEYIVIPGTDVPTSQAAIAIAEKYEHIYVAAGIHPHHVFDLMQKKDSLDMDNEIKKIEELLVHPKVVAVGEVGLDRHVYENTKYEAYAVNDEFIALQKKLLEEQIKLAIQYKKSVIFHNREAKAEMLALLTTIWDESLRGHSVFHCCEPDNELLEFAKGHGMFLGVDGDITYYPEKQEFIKHVPDEMLVLETDAPFLLPEPLRTEKRYPNEPANLTYISEFISELKDMPLDILRRTTLHNGKALFSLP